MNAQDRINAFTLAAHRVAVDRLRAHPARVAEALHVLERWRVQAGGPSHSDRYWDEWEQLLRLGVEAVEQAVCIDTDHAATLRSVSPLGRFLAAEERFRLLRDVRQAA